MTALALGVASPPWTRAWPNAVLTGIVFTGLGHAIWYAALSALSAIRAATMQLSVPVIAALGAVALLHEPITLRLIVASASVLGGRVMVILGKQSLANRPQ